MHMLSYVHLEKNYTTLVTSYYWNALSIHLYVIGRSVFIECDQFVTYNLFVW